MMVTVSVDGRFHAFHLARELQVRGNLDRLLTTYPRFEVVKYGVDRRKVDSLVANELARRAWSKLAPTMRPGVDASLVLAEAFDRRVRRRLKGGSDMFVGWSSKSLLSLRRAKELGMKTVIERGSAHILTQVQLLEEEHERHGLRFDTHHGGITERELQEYEEADFVAVPSLFAKRSFIANGVPEEKLLHTPYGVDLRNFIPGTKRDEVFRIIYCGGRTLRKGLTYLLQAFTELQMRNSELLLVGPGSKDTDHMIAQYANQNVRTIGPFPERDLRDYYSQGSVFCQPSVEEGLSLVQLQAMACGLPVIATTNTGAEDIIEDGQEGFIVPIRDPEAIKSKLLLLCESPELLAEMGQASLRRAQTGLTWSDYGDRVVGEYQRAMGPDYVPPPY